MNMEWRQMLHFYSDNNSCLRKEVWKEIPYPNVRHGEDQVWGLQVIEAGYEKIYAIDAWVYHSHSYTPEQIKKVARIETAFFKKYFDYDSVKPKWEWRA